MKVRLVKTEYIVQEVQSEVYVDIKDLDKISKMSLEDQEDELTYLFSEAREFIWVHTGNKNGECKKEDFIMGEYWSILGQVITIDPPNKKGKYVEPKLLSIMETPVDINKDITDWSKLELTTPISFIRDIKLDELLK